ncbi:MAG: hypothetical protein UEA60_09850 [Lachnospiraceae bacterium]|nr:hypothetical protein [Lachnospiraceae bacterium]
MKDLRDLKTGIWLADTGEGYLLIDDVNNMDNQFDYGMFLVKLLYVGKQGFINVYRHLHAMISLDYEIDINLYSEENKRMDAKLDASLKEVGMDGVAGYYVELNNAFMDYVPADARGVLSPEEKSLLFSIVMSDVIESIKAGKKDYIPEIFLDDEVIPDLEKFLDGKVGDVEALNKYLLMGSVESVSQYLTYTTIKKKGKVEEKCDVTELVSVWHITSIVQFLIIEILNVIKHADGIPCGENAYDKKQKHKKTIKLRRCVECGKLFVIRNSKGHMADYCNYEGLEGFCKEIVAIRNKEGRTKIEIHCEKVLERIRKKSERWGEYFDRDKAEKAFEKEKQRLLAKGVDEGTFMKEIDDWWDTYCYDN